MKPPEKAVYGIGQCALDYIGIIDRFPDPDEKCEFRDLVIQGGGPVATALVALQRWGYNCTFCGVIGDDRFGREILSGLKRESINLSGLRIRAHGTSQFAFSVAEPATGHRTIFWRRPTGDRLRAEEIEPEQILRADLLYTDGLFPEASLEACKIARRAEIPVIIDAGTLRPGMEDLLSVSTCFIASETFARAYMPGASVEAICRALAAQGPLLAAVTLGAEGYAACFGGDFIRRPAYPVKTIDTTGCGDLFHAGFAYGFLKSWPFGRALGFGAWAAAMVSRFPGGRTGIPDPKEWPGE